MDVVRIEVLIRPVLEQGIDESPKSNVDDTYSFDCH